MTPEDIDRIVNGKPEGEPVKPMPTALLLLLAVVLFLMLASLGFGAAMLFGVTMMEATG